MKKVLKAFSVVALLFCSLFMLASCNKVTEKNYNKIEVNMAKSKVVDILGESNESTVLSDYVVYYWFDKADNMVEANEKVASGKAVKCIIITMSEDVVISKEYKDWTIAK